MTHDQTAKHVLVPVEQIRDWYTQVFVMFAEAAEEEDERPTPVCMVEMEAMISAAPQIEPKLPAIGGDRDAIAKAGYEAWVVGEDDKDAYAWEELKPEWQVPWLDFADRFLARQPDASIMREALEPVVAYIERYKLMKATQRIAARAALAPVAADGQGVG